MKWLITGGSGQLASALSTKLTEVNESFISLDRNSLDITCFSNVHSALNDFNPDIVVNCGAYNDVNLAEIYPEKAFSVNAEAPKYLAETCKELDCQFIHISTDYVFSGSRNKPWLESDFTKPISVYGKSKEKGEKIALATHPSGTKVIRTGWLYSLNQGNFLTKVIDKLVSGNSSIPVVSDQLGQPTSVFDLSDRILVSGISNISPGIYHGTNSGQTSRSNFAKEIAKSLGFESSRIVEVSSVEYSQAEIRPSYSVLSHNAWSDVGLSPMRSWEFALTDSLNRLKRGKSEND